MMELRRDHFGTCVRRRQNLNHLRARQRYRCHHCLRALHRPESLHNRLPGRLPVDALYRVHTRFEGVPHQQVA
jgi:hypothetical protein